MPPRGYVSFMKTSAILPACILFGLVSCDTMNAPIADGEFDPMRTPGAGLSSGSSTSGIRPGTFVVAAIDNTAFYNQRPGAEADADKLLSRGTSMKVISTSGSFYRVELDSGEVGFVPTVMVEDPNAMADDSGQPFELYPAGFDVEPLPEFPADVPVGSVPEVIEPGTEPAPDAEPAPAPDTEPAPATEEAAPAAPAAPAEQ